CRPPLYSEHRRLIYLLRHGQTEFNAERRIQGQCDSALTPLGREQARGLGLLLCGALAGEGAFEMVCSPLGRTVATAAPRPAQGPTRPSSTSGAATARTGNVTRMPSPAHAAGSPGPKDAGWWR